MIDYNFLIFREGISRVFELRSKKLENNADDLSEEYNFQQPSSVTDSV